MFNTQWTLENDGVEKSFADWGLSNLRITYNSQATDSCSFEGPGADFDSPVLFEPWSICKVRGGRVGSGTTWEDGEVWFVGPLSKSPRRANGRSESRSYELFGLGYYFDNLPFEQYIRSYVAPNGTHCATTDPWTCGLSPNGYAMVSDGDSEWELIPATSVILNQGTDGFRDQMGAQVREILDFLIANGAPFQYDSAVGGEVDTQFGTLELPTDERPDLSCAAALAQELGWVPDVETWTDYSTDPPTLHIKRRGNLTPVDVDAVAGIEPESLAIMDREDMRRSQVVLKYWRPVELDGQVWRKSFEDKYPPGAPPDVFNVLKQSVELLGFVGVTQLATLETQDIPVNLEAAGAVQFWKNHAPWLAGMTNIAIVAGSSSRKLVANGVVTATNGTLPRKLANGNGTEWTSFEFAEEEFKVEVNYDMPHGSRREQDPIVFRIRTTDGTTGDFSQVATQQSAEEVPVGLAEQIWTALDQPQFEGEFAVVREECTKALAVGQKLNLTNGPASWASMAMPVKSVTHDVDEGRSTVRFGPNRYLSSGELVELMRVTRTRRVTFATAARGSGLSSPSTSEVGRDVPKENTAAGPGRYQKLLVAPVTAEVATKGKVHIQVEPATSGSHAENKFSTLGTDVRLRETPMCDPDDPEAGTQYAMVMRSPIYPDRKTTGALT